MKRLLAAMFLFAAVTPAAAQVTDAEPEPTAAPKMMSSGSDLKNAMDECKSHPSVVAAGTPLEICMEAYGFVKDSNGKWVHKPPTR